MRHELDKDGNDVVYGGEMGALTLWAFCLRVARLVCGLMNW
jgi:hypothetical protein